MSIRNIGRILFFITGVTFAVSPLPSLAQNDACSTVNIGHPHTACQHPGAGCNLDGSGPNTGRCVFLPTDRTCECEPHGGGSPGATAVVGNALSAPVYVNLYWDANWDADNPLPKDELDEFTATLLNSSYFGGLSEYGVGTPSFGGGFLPDAQCRQKAPARVGFYAPIDPSISDFLQCELDHGGIPQGSQIVYNVILPSGSLESDLFGSRTLCTGGANAWHFHQTPYTTEAKIALGLGLLGLSTGGPGGALEVFLGVLELLQGGPVYTIVSADPQCGNFVNNLIHEMVEAASDPFPPSGVILSSGGGETVDICDDRNAPASAPFVPQPGRVLPPQQSFPAFGRFTMSSTISVPQYWSNAGQMCVTGFTDSTTPMGPGSGPLKPTIAGNGAAISLTFAGSGFGRLPNPPLWNPPWNINLPYIAIQNETQGWQAGNTLNSDFITLNISSWSDTAIAVTGLNFNIGNLVMQPGDRLSYWVCNPASGNCKFGSNTLVESGLPQLKVFVNNTNNVALSYDLLIDGVKVAGPLANGMSTGWLSFSGNPTLAITENATHPGFFTPKFINGGCDSSGHISLKPGDNQTCRILNIVNNGCATGQHCCSGATSAAGCVAGCVADAVTCEPACGTGRKCCGEQLPNGRCDELCVPTHLSCQ
jgi:hypothetical protein